MEPGHESLLRHQHLTRGQDTANAELKAEMTGRPIVAQEREVLSNNPSYLQQARMFGRKHPVWEGSGSNRIPSCW